MLVNRFHYSCAFSKAGCAKFCVLVKIISKLVLGKFITLNFLPRIHGLKKWFSHARDIYSFPCIRGNTVNPW
jgi:hypothetical protein